MNYVINRGYKDLLVDNSDSQEFGDKSLTHLRGLRSLSTTGIVIHEYDNEDCVDDEDGFNPYLYFLQYKTA